MTDHSDRSRSGQGPDSSRELLARLISVYGANPGRWPQDVRNLVPEDLGIDPELRSQLEIEASLDEALDSVPALEISNRLREQLLTQFERYRERESARLSRRIARFVASLRELVWPGAPWWQPAFALSLSVLIGLSAGLAIPDSLSDSGDQQVSSLSDAPTSADIDQGQ